jgi:hypothetical protein
VQIDQPQKRDQMLLSGIWMPNPLTAIPITGEIKAVVG